MAEFWKIVSVFLTSALGFGKISVPTAVTLFDFNFWKVMLITCSGGFTGIIVFTNISDVFLKWIHSIKVKYFKSHPHPKVFTKGNRRIVKIIQKFGIWGIAFFTPIGLSIPVGAFIAERFYKNKKKVMLVLGAAVVFWNTTIYLLLRFFYESVSSVL